jgi:hypothetical protein
MESASHDYAPARPAKRTFSKRYIVIIIIVVLISAGSFMFIRSTGSTSTEDIYPTPFEIPTEIPTPEITQSASPSAAPTATSSVSPTPTRPASVNKATDMNIQILNGSGEVGVAGTVRDFLISKGYKYLETNNADNYEYQNVSVKIKSSLETYGSALKNDLAEKYTISSDSATLPNDSLFDAVVTVGK